MKIFRIHDVRDSAYRHVGTPVETYWDAKQIRFHVVIVRFAPVPAACDWNLDTFVLHACVFPQMCRLERAATDADVKRHRDIDKSGSGYERDWNNDVARPRHVMASVEGAPRFFWRNPTILRASRGALLESTLL